MSEESAGLSRRLQLTITPKLDLSQLTDKIKGDLEGTSTTDSKGTGSTSKRGEQDKEDTKQEKREKAEKSLKVSTSISKAVDKGFDTGKQLMSGIFGVISEIMNRVKASSQFLQTVEGLFNLAITLLLMPLGNAIAETILPATIELVDAVLGLWDEMGVFSGGASLEHIVSVIFDKGLVLIGDYFKNIGGMLQGQGSMLGSIGNLLVWIGDLLESGALVDLLEIAFDMFQFFTENIRLFIGLYVAHETAKVGLMLTQIAVAALPEAAKLTGAGIALGVTTAVAVGAGVGVANMFADGGYVPAREGGQTVRVAESGEGEYIIPESKMGSVGGGQNITNNFYGYTSDELIRIVKDVLKDEVQTSRYQGL